MRERRRHIRTAPRRPDLQATVQLDGRPVTGRVIDLTAAGAGIALLREGTPEVPIGVDTNLTLESPLLLRTARFKVCLRRWQEVGPFIKVGLEFADPAIAQHQIPGLLRADFNRRRQPRLTFAKALPATALFPDGDGVTAGLANLCVGGAALRVDRESYGHGGSTERIQVSFWLPGEPREFLLGATIVGEQSVGTRTTLSVRFLSDGSDDHSSQIALLNVMVAQAMESPGRPRP